MITFTIFMNRKKEAFIAELAQWVLLCNIARTHVTQLLHLLGTQEHFDFLPKTCNTLIKTPRTAQLHDVNPGEYFHAGLAAGIVCSLEALNVDLSTVSTFRNIISSDGTSLSESSRSEMWVILGRLFEFQASPFEIGLFHGS